MDEGVVIFLCLKSGSEECSPIRKSKRYDHLLREMEREGSESSIHVYILGNMQNNSYHKSRVSQMLIVYMDFQLE